MVGYTDPDLVDVPRDSPTLAARSRFILYAIAAASRWRLFKGDIKTAFLQGAKDELDRNVFGRPPPELLSYLKSGPEYVV